MQCCLPTLKISHYMRDVMVEHAATGSTPFDVLGSSTIRRQSIMALIRRGWLRFERPMRPRYTYLTQAGRAEVALLLADIADNLVKAGALDWGVDDRPTLDQPVAEKNNPTDRTASPGVLPRRIEIGKTALSNALADVD